MAKLTKEQMQEMVREIAARHPKHRKLRRDAMAFESRVTIAAYKQIVELGKILDISVEHNCTENDAQQIKLYGEVRW